MPTYKGAFSGCTWCYGNGCLMCDKQRAEAEARAMQPIFAADRNDPDDMEALTRVIHADVLTKEFGPGGGGIQAIERTAAIESIKQLFRKAATGSNDANG